MSVPNGVNGHSDGDTHGETIDCDVVIVGGGFSGMYALHKLRGLGFKAKIFEEGSDFGGVWYWNRYPGARVDSEYPFYQLSIPEVWRHWNFSERFPDHTELRNYMAHIDKVLHLRKDTYFNSQVVSAQYDKDQARWTIRTVGGHVATGKYIILATGLLHKSHVPDFPGLSNYQGEVYHSGSWPEGLDVKGKKVAVIGTGATSVQIVQELSKVADHLSNFMRRPSHCLPMGNRPLSSAEQNALRALYPIFFKAGRNSASGLPLATRNQSIFDDTPEEREARFEEAWARGGFGINGIGYTDIFVDKKANRLLYDFWAKKTRARMTDPVKRDLMAPLEPGYWIGTKRQPLEHDYYECIDLPTVEVIDLNAAPIRTFSEKGIVTEDGKEREFDIVVLATGFESYTGS